jgi:hypothetical protein
LVDRAAPYVVGEYLYKNDKKPLYDLVKSKNPIERRTALSNNADFDFKSCFLWLGAEQTKIL